MARWLRLVLGTGVVLLTVTGPVQACKLYSPQPFRKEIEQAKLVIYGTVTEKPGGGLLGRGTHELKVLQVLKPHQALAGRKVIELTQITVDVDPKNPAQFVF